MKMVRSIAVLILTLTVVSQSSFGAPQTNETLKFAVDYSNVPEVSFNELTYLLPVGQIANAVVLGDGAEVPSQYDSTAGVVRFTTDASRIQVQLNGVVDANEIGPLEKATLKYDKKWAWSIGFDDNTGIKASIDVLDSFGYPGTLFMICNIIDDTRVEDWIIDKPDLLNYLANGWSIGNHTWDHECDGSGDLTSTILQGYERLAEIAAESVRPDYKVTSFAAPCFTSEYHPYILDMRDNNVNAVQFNESGGDYRIAVDDVGGSDFWLIDRFVQVFDFDRRIGRDAQIAWDPVAAKSEIDWIASQATPELHFWYNSLLHGGQEANVQEVAQHVYDNYGAGGTNEVWVAPSDQIYSYLLVRERTTIASIIETVPSTVNIVQGELAAGSVSELETSDDVDLVVRRGVSQVAAVVEIELQSQTTIANPGLFEFTVEGSAFYRTQVVQAIYFYDFDAGQFVEVGLQDASRFVDSVSTVNGSGDLSRFVDGSGEVRGRVRFTSSVPRQRFTVSLDQAFWVID